MFSDDSAVPSGLESVRSLNPTLKCWAIVGCPFGTKVGHLWKFVAHCRPSALGFRFRPYGSAVTATRNGWPGVGLSDVKSNWRSGASGNGFSHVVLNSRTLPPLAR